MVAKGAWTRGLERVPLSWPSWMTPPRAATGIVALAATTTTGLLTAWLTAPGFNRALLVGAGGLTATLLSRWACRAPTPARAVPRSVAAGAIQSFFTAGVLAPLFVMLADGSRSSGGPGIFLAFGIGALIVGVPFGGAIGLAYAILPGVVARLRARPSHSDVDRVLTTGGAWLLAVSMLHALVLSNMKSFAYQERTAVEEALLTSAWAAPLAIAVLLFASTALQAIRRSRFLAAARMGEDVRFRIAPRAGREAPIGVLPLLHGIEPEKCDSVLVRIGEPPREVLYRDAAELEAEERVVALLP